MGRPKVPRIEVTQEYLRSVLHYDAETGIFTWLKDSSVAGAPRDERGYIRITLSRYNRHYAHRLAFIYMIGSCPEYVDHIDEDKSNTKWLNLRGATKSQNGMNRAAPKNNTSGVKGVYWQANRFVAQVMADGKKHYLGRFRTVAEAEKAISTARASFHGEFSRG